MCGGFARSATSLFLYSISLISYISPGRVLLLILISFTMALTVEQIRYLQDDEISYEIQIRNCLDSGTPEENLTVLRGLLELERIGQTTIHSVCYPKPTHNSKVCLDKLKKMSGMIKNFINSSW